jgi:protein TonB
MARQTFRLPEARSELPLSVVLGTGCAIALFVLMGLAQMMGKVVPPKSEIEEAILAYVPPEIEEIEEEPLPPLEEEEPPPELDREPQQLSLEQLDIALNPGTGGSLLGDFAMPSIETSQSDLGTQDFVDFSDLDQIPRPIGVSGLNFPRRLRKKAVNGTIVLLLKLNDEGDVLDVEIDSSNLPAFDAFVLGEVKRWKFTPPTQNGQPVRAKARLPIPIRIS